jgi:hypothetical protein
MNSLIQAANAGGYLYPRYLKTITYLIAGKMDFGLPL